MTPTVPLALLRLALPVPLRREFDYLCPQPLPAAGCRVRVPFGRQMLVGVVTDHPVSSDIPRDRLRSIDTILDPAPLFNGPLWQMLRWASRYYQHPAGEVFDNALPVLLRQGEPAARQPLEGWQLCDAPTGSPSTRAPRQQQALQLLQDGPLASADLREQGIDSAVLQRLEDKGCIRRLDLLADREAWADTLLVHQDDQPQLNTEQALTVAAISSQDREYAAFLLEGITGSGKTEVYLQLMANVLARGQQVLVLVPEIGLTPQTLARFRRRFSAPILTLHSGMTDRERLDAWVACRDGEAAVLVGTRSALFTPFARLGLILIDEEHDASFKQQDSFRYHARDLAVLRARLENCPIVLGSATPSLESLHNVTLGKYQLLRLTQRAGGARPATQAVLDIKHVPLTAGLSPQLQQLMQQHLQQGNQVMLFLNRRGYAQALICHHCGWIAGCARCDAWYTWHQGSQRLHCHHCDGQRPLPSHCPDCGSAELVGTGVGTEQLEAALQALFPTYRTVRIDRDSTRRKGELEAALQAIRQREVQILIGTQMLAKGHHFPDVTLVGLLDVDGALFSQDFRATERLAQLYTQVAGRAGRASKPGQVVLQTHHPEHLLLQDLVQNGYAHFARTCLQERQQLDLPPWSCQALLRTDATGRPEVVAFLTAAAALLPGCCQGCPTSRWHGPVSAIMERRAGRYRMQLLLQAHQRAELALVLERWLPLLEALPEARRVRWSLDVDPQEVL